MERPIAFTPLLGINLKDLEQVFKVAGFEAYDPSRLLVHYYRQRNPEIDLIEVYPKKLRSYLKEKFHTQSLQPLISESSIDGTNKWLFKSVDGNPFETAWIPDQNRQTVCISTQSGCKFGCKFCMTGSLGFKSHLSVFEVLSQVVSIGKSFSHVVFMGMGEPLDNFEVLSRTLEILTAPWGYSLAARNITVSTVGVLPALERLGMEHTCNIAISLHSPFAEQRAEIIPSEKRYPLRDIIRTLEKIPFRRKRRLSLEYLLMKDFNDRYEHAAALGALIKHLPAHINIIPYNFIPGKPYRAPDPQDAENFRQVLNSYGLRATIRKSRGYDISAACGMMAGRTTLSHELLNKPVLKF